MIGRIPMSHLCGSSLRSKVFLGACFTFAILHDVFSRHCLPVLALAMSSAALVFQQWSVMQMCHLVRCSSRCLCCLILVMFALHQTRAVCIFVVVFSLIFYLWKSDLECYCLCCVVHVVLICMAFCFA